jgi:hypothetical protein
MYVIGFSWEPKRTNASTPQRQPQLGREGGFKQYAIASETFKQVVSIKDTKTSSSSSLNYCFFGAIMSGYRFVPNWMMYNRNNQSFCLPAIECPVPPPHSYFSSPAPSSCSALAETVILQLYVDIWLTTVCYSLTPKQYTVHKYFNFRKQKDEAKKVRHP